MEKRGHSCGTAKGEDKKQDIPDRNMNRSKDQEALWYRVFFRNG